MLRTNRQLRRQRSGFTLFEVMTATVIVALIVTVVYGTYRATLTGSQRCRQRLELYREALSLSDRLAGQLAACRPMVGGVTDGAEGFRLEQDNGQWRLELITGRSLVRVNERGLFRVQWRTDARGRLWYREMPYLAAEPTGQPVETEPELLLSPQTVRLELEPLDQAGQTDTTPAAHTPAAVRIHLTVSGPEPSSGSITLHTLAPVRARTDAITHDGEPRAESRS